MPLSDLVRSTRLDFDMAILSNFDICILIVIQIIEIILIKLLLNVIFKFNCCLQDLNQF